MPLRERLSMSSPLQPGWGHFIPVVIDLECLHSGNPEQLKEALLLMMKNSKLRREYGRKGREKVVVKFSMDRMIAQYISLYDTILERTIS